MIELVLTFCLATTAPGAPEACITQRPLLAEELTRMSCLIAGPQLGAELVQQHPGYRFAGWKCEIGQGKRDERAI